MIGKLRAGEAFSYKLQVNSALYSDNAQLIDLFSASDDIFIL